MPAQNRKYRYQTDDYGLRACEVLPDGSLIVVASVVKGRGRKWHAATPRGYGGSGNTRDAAVDAARAKQDEGDGVALTTGVGCAVAEVSKSLAH